MNNKKRIHIIALAALGEGLSGGDRIFIEFARRWSRKMLVNLYVWEEGLLMCQRENLRGKFLHINLVKVSHLSRLGFIFTYFYRVFLGIKLGLSIKVTDGDYIYSASEFWMDSLPAFILKLRKRNKINWVAAWFQTAPNPIKGFSEGTRRHSYRLNALVYWLIQRLIKPLIAKLADFVLVNNNEEKKQFPVLAKRNRTIVVLGGVNTVAISQYLKMHKRISKRRYLAVFQGRFHPQKGVVELIDIWKLVTQNIPDAKLAMIGNGPLMKDVKKRIKALRLKNNVELFGYLHDGSKKYSIFQSSRIVVHPAFYDSGGMASAEAMAFGLPCVGFDLQAYSFYYPQGMIKVPIGNQKAFAGEIVQLNNNKSIYNTISMDARNMIMEKYSWTKRAAEIFDILGLAK